MRKTLISTLASGALCVCLGASAAEIKVLTAGAFKPVVTALVPEFEKQTGHKVTVENDTAGALTKRISGGEAFDLIILTPGALTELTKVGKVVDGSAKSLARVAIGVAVKKGATLPDISTVAAFQNAPSPISTRLRAAPAAFISRNCSKKWASRIASKPRRYWSPAASLRNDW